MIKTSTIILVSAFLLIISCSKEIKKETILSEKKLELQVVETYKEGIKALDEGDVLFAAKKFNEVELMFPQSDLAPKSAIMAAYAYYSQDYYFDSIAELIRFIRVYPNYKNIDYVYYLLAINYYEQIVDEKKDLNSIIKAKESFEFLANKYPDTDYALDANFKLDLINEILASKEMYIAGYYFDKKKWIPAINRYKTVVKDYDTTIFVEEALHRLVEIHYIIGLRNEAYKYASLLGYNYESSKWYENSYKIFNSDYKKKIITEKKNNIVIKKIKSLFE